MSSMKVGVDAVLTGALAPVEGVTTVLDAGCGCGVIALMLAQRAPGARIRAIDTDEASVNEARENFLKSPWGARLEAECADFSEESSRYDLIVSNPPFFRSGITSPDSARLAARHQASLSPFVLLHEARRLLNPGGRLCFVCPSWFEEEVKEHACREGLQVLTVVRISGHSQAPVKRIVVTATPLAIVGREGIAELEAERRGPCPEIKKLILEKAPGIPADEYRALCREFYLKF